MLMADILLIDTNTTPFNEAFPVYPSGLDYLQSAVSDSGLGRPDILDLTRTGGLLNKNDPDERRRKSLTLIKRSIEERDWNVIGLSLRNIDSTYPVGEGKRSLHYFLPDLKDYIDCIESVKKDETFLILGGTGFSLMSELFMKNRSDKCYGVVGPAEESLPRLIENLLNGVPCHGITRRKNHRIGKLQNRDLILEFLKIPVNENIFGIRTKIGCNQKCGYCPYPLINGPGHTLKHVNDVMEEILLLKDLKQELDNHQEFRIMFADDIFNRPLDHAKDILKAVLGYDNLLDSRHAYLDPKSIDKEFIELIFETGGWSRLIDSPGFQREYFFPLDIESGSPRILKKTWLSDGWINT